MDAVQPLTNPFKYHAECDNADCTFNLATNDYEMRAVMVGQHRIRNGHSVTLTEVADSDE